MKFLIVSFLLLGSTQVFANTNFTCDFVNHDNKKGKVEITIKDSTIELEFKKLTVKSADCKVELTPSEVTVECEEQSNSIAVILELINGKFEGYLASEKASIFGQIKC